MNFSNINVLIFGASSDIGKCLSKILIEYGATVIGVFHNKLCENELIDKYYCDVCNESEIKDTFTKIKNKHEYLNVVINLVATCNDCDMYELTKESFLKTLETNLVGTFLINKYASINMDSGVIINMSSTDATDTYSTMSMDYAASKAGVENLTKNLAKRLPKLKICALAPNWIDTTPVLEMNPVYLESELKRVGQSKLIKKEDVALKIIEIILDDDIRSGSIIKMEESHV